MQLSDDHFDTVLMCARRERARTRKNIERMIRKFGAEAQLVPHREILRDIDELLLDLARIQPNSDPGGS